MNNEECMSKQPQSAAPVFTADAPSSQTPSFPLLPSFNIPQSQTDWDADNSTLGGTLVQQVVDAPSVDVKNSVLCNGICSHFTSKYGLCKKGRKSQRAATTRPRRHNRTMKKVTQQKNEARRELRAARRDGRDEITIREVARKFHTLIRLHSKTKKKH